MKAKIPLVFRVLMGALFVFSGSNKVYMFMEMPQLQEPMLSLMNGMMQSGMIKLLGVTEVACGLLFLMGRYVPLALVIIAPVVLNILLIHITIEPTGMPVAVFLVVAWFVVGMANKDRLMGLLKP